MTSRRRRQATAAAELNRLRRPLEHIDLPDPRDPSLRHRVDGFILDYHRGCDLGLPTSDEYSVIGWLAVIADRAQDFEQGTVYLDSATGSVGTAGWSAYRPLDDSDTELSSASADQHRRQHRVER